MSEKMLDLVGDAYEIVQRTLTTFEAAPAYRRLGAGEK
jgi:hypothetical protein